MYILALRSCQRGQLGWVCGLVEALFWVTHSLPLQWDVLRAFCGKTLNVSPIYRQSNAAGHEQAPIFLLSKFYKWLNYLGRCSQKALTLVNSSSYPCESPASLYLSLTQPNPADCLYCGAGPERARWACELVLCQWGSNSGSCSVVVKDAVADPMHAVCL